LIVKINPTGFFSFSTILQYYNSQFQPNQYLRAYSGSENKPRRKGLAIYFQFQYFILPFLFHFNIRYSIFSIRYSKSVLLIVFHFNIRYSIFSIGYSKPVLLIFFSSYIDTLYNITLYNIRIRFELLSIPTGLFGRWTETPQESTCVYSKSVLSIV